MMILRGTSQDLYSGMKLIENCLREFVAIHTSDKELQEFSDRIYIYSGHFAAKSDIISYTPQDMIQL